MPSGQPAPSQDDEWNPPDLFAHPPAPRVVAHGQAGGPKPCATCHLFNGAGSLGVPDLAGLPAAYMIEQIGQFRSGRRHSSEEMMAVAKGLGDAEFARACAYYAKLPRVASLHVVETARVPLTQPDRYGMLNVLSGGRTEPIGGRIIEVAADSGTLFFPEDPGAVMTLEEPSGVVVYVPKGAVARGMVLARSGGAAGQSCALCHGTHLRGAGHVPPLAGRSAAYLARAMEDIRTGARGGRTVAPMRPIARGLSATDVRNVAAYLASLKP